jgi:hypothetical protein
MALSVQTEQAGGPSLEQHKKLAARLKAQFDAEKKRNATSRPWYQAGTGSTQAPIANASIPTGIMGPFTADVTQPSTPAAAAAALQGMYSMPQSIQQSMMPNIDIQKQFLGPADAPYQPGGGIDIAQQNAERYATDAMTHAQTAFGAQREAMAEPLAQTNGLADFATRLAGNVSQAFAPNMGGHDSAEAQIKTQVQGVQERQAQRLQLLERHADILAERAMRLGDTVQAQKYHTQAQRASDQHNALLAGTAAQQNVNQQNMDTKNTMARDVYSRRVQLARDRVDFNTGAYAQEHGVRMNENGEFVTVLDDPNAGMIAPTQHAALSAQANAEYTKAVQGGNPAEVKAATMNFWRLGMQPLTTENNPWQQMKRIKGMKLPLTKGFMHLGSPINTAKLRYVMFPDKPAEDVTDNDWASVANSIADQRGLSPEKKLKFFKDAGFDVAPK